MERNNPIVVKSKALALRIIRLNRYLCDEEHEYVLSKQVLRSGTSIGANVREALRGYSRKEFYARLNIALREASETEYWLELLHESDMISEEAFISIYQDTQEIIRLLVSIIKTRKPDEG
ncbi:MAG: four helix bundle protein [Clostridiales bacterium]|nr:four helix bundle protein [Clostridiales bacterium]